MHRGWLPWTPNFCCIVFGEIAQWQLVFAELLLVFVCMCYVCFTTASPQTSVVRAERPMPFRCMPHCATNLAVARKQRDRAALFITSQIYIATAQDSDSEMRNHQTWPLDNAHSLRETAQPPNPHSQVVQNALLSPETIDITPSPHSSQRCIATPRLHTCVHVNCHTSDTLLGCRPAGG